MFGLFVQKHITTMFYADGIDVFKIMSFRTKTNYKKLMKVQSGKTDKS